MARKNRKHKNRVKNLALICTITTILLVTSTYAWFVGMRTAKISSFDVEIAAVDGLSLSLDGKNWTESLNVTSTAAYDGNTNIWADKGLIPMSTVGVVDSTSSTLKLYEKASLTTTEGGYRVLASRVNNNIKGTDEKYAEKEGYVAFDLFIRNLSGEEYYAGPYNEKNEEAIYLTNDSFVKVASTGGVEGTGIENSVRIAFAQIGRVIASSTDYDKITGLTCTSDVVPEDEDAKQYATGICRTATIWEPNDRRHTADAISYYNNSCMKRDNSTGAYSGACNPLVDGIAKTTYAISDVINYKTEAGEAAPVVDIYDGADLNGYTKSTVLNAFDTFTDTEKLLTGTDRPQFFSLAPNSITKVRVYIYIEGQDVDNYDLAQIGKKVSISFGFTKERFTEDDLNYQGPATNEGDGPFVWDEDSNAYVSANDTTKPFIVLEDKNAEDSIEVANDKITVVKDTEITLADVVKATAYDKLSTFTKSTVDGKDVYTVSTTTDNKLTDATITTSGTFNTSTVGTYEIVYSVKDTAGNLGTKVLTIEVVNAAS